MPVDFVGSSRGVIALTPRNVARLIVNSPMQWAEVIFTSSDVKEAGSASGSHRRSQISVAHGSCLRPQLLAEFPAYFERQPFTPKPHETA
jgi:hypothetical protein